MGEQTINDDESLSSSSPHNSIASIGGENASETSLDESHQESVDQAAQIYAQERDKRVRADGASQFVDAESSEKFKRFAADCWLESDDTLSQLALEDGSHCRCLIIGGGFGGLLFAVRLVQAGFKPSDLVIVDVAGGFGGTWYWNRYPGLMCDVESYIYLPLLEETGYMPKHKYAYGSEIREHANRIAKHWSLHDRAAFRTQAKKLSWCDIRNVWDVELAQNSVKDETRKKFLHITADFVIAASGFLHKPQITDCRGINEFHGHSFHTARWDYRFTGGSQDDPSLIHLRGKKAGIIGTGATAIQVVPHLAKWSKELYVFQRTPASVDVRGQHPTDPEWWRREIQGKKGWQKERSRNFISFTVNTQPQPRIDMVDDGWTHCPSFAGVVGTPKKVAFEDAPAYVAEMQALDLERSQRIRSRVDKVVRDKKTADSLKPWYYAWCKRPTFHDEYLSTFNRPNVTLVDTNGKGVEDVTTSGVVANGQLYELDVIVFSTGFTFQASSSPAARAGIVTFGRRGRYLEDKWREELKNLHGIMTRDFPNLFFSALSQGAGSVNFTSALDASARHVAFIIAKASENMDSNQKFTIEPTAIAEDNWGELILAGSGYRATAAGCTPSYYNGHGMMDKLSTEMKTKVARTARYPHGLNSFNDFLDEWHAKGDLSELDIRPI